MSGTTKVANAAKAAAIIMIISLISKILGFGREMTFAAKFGAGTASDSFVMATTIPMVIFQMIGSSIATTFIPVFTEYMSKEGKEKAYELTNNIINILLILTIVLSILGIIFTPLLVRLIAANFRGEHYTLTVQLSRFLFPIIIFIALSNVATGVLQAQNHFTAAASVGIPYNIIVIYALIAFTSRYGIYAMTVATIIATASQIIIQLPDMYKLGYRYKFTLNLRHPGIIKIFSLIIPVIIGTAVTQINVIVDRTFASGLPSGAVAALNYANRLNGFVMGIFGFAISTVIYPTLANTISLKDMEGYKRSFKFAINAIFMVMVPITVITIILKIPIVSIVYRRGNFDYMATYLTAVALLYYAIGMTAFSVRDVLNKAFYAVQDTKTPMIFGIYAVIINILLNLILVKVMGIGGLAFSTSVAGIITSFMMFFSIRKKLNGIGGKDILTTMFKILISTVFMGIVTYFTFDFLNVYFQKSGFLIWLLEFMVSSAAGLLVYVISLLLLKVDELMVIKQMALKALNRFAIAKR